MENTKRNPQFENVTVQAASTEKNLWKPEVQLPKSVHWVGDICDENFGTSDYSTVG